MTRTALLHSETGPRIAGGEGAMTASGPGCGWARCPQKARDDSRTARMQAVAARRNPLGAVRMETPRGLHRVARATSPMGTRSGLTPGGEGGERLTPFGGQGEEVVGTGAQ